MDTIKTCEREGVPQLAQIFHCNHILRYQTGPGIKSRTFMPSSAKPRPQLSEGLLSKETLVQEELGLRRQLSKGQLSKETFIQGSFYQ